MPSNKRHTVRIIGGKWKRRKLVVTNAEGLRPTPNRVRESLFNWLNPEISGARVLDLYAGTGALGFEALSRDAAKATFVDSDPQVVAELEKSAAVLQVSTTIVCCDATCWLKHQTESWDIVFLDPPFESQLHLQTLDLLPNHLEGPALVYIERPRKTEFEHPNYEVEKKGFAGEVSFTLLRLRNPRL